VLQQRCYCTKDGICIFRLEDVLSHFNGLAQNNEQASKARCETADLLLYRKVYYDWEREP